MGGNLVLNSFLPEVFLSLCILAQLVFNVLLTKNLKYNYPLISREVFAQTVFILFCVVVLLLKVQIQGYFFNFLFLNDTNSLFLKAISIVILLIAMFYILISFDFHELNFPEYFTLLLLSALALLLLISSADLLSAYLAIEMQALAFYVLAAFQRKSAFSTEAGLKYFVAGAFISGIFLCGCSLLYGVHGTLNLHNLSLLLSIYINEFQFIFDISFLGLLLVTVSFLFKLSVVPFHFWSPDVYDGSPLASTIVFAVLPKIAIFSFLIKWLSLLNNQFVIIENFLLLCGIFSTILGTFFAIRQKRLKRLIIFSSIAQTGFLITALSFFKSENLTSIYFFLIIYLLTTTLVWSLFSIFYSFQMKTKKFYQKKATPLFFSTISNLFQFNYVWAFSFVIVYFSIAGVPPFSGFLSKLFVILSVVEVFDIPTALTIILISAVSSFYYLKFIKSVFFEHNVDFNSINNSLVIFNTKIFFLDCLLIATLLFLVFFVFFFPANLLLICNLLTLGSFFV